ENNTVYKLNTTGLSNGTNFQNASIVAISVISNTEGNAQSITKNTVHNIETTATGKIELYGIFFDGPDATEAIISRNFVHTFVVPTDGSTGTYLHGISLYDGSYISSNNIVYLGSNITIGCSIWGIWTGTNDAGKIYHNTIYLTGTATSGTSNSYAFRSLNCPSSLDLRNNILWDGRVNNSGVISHFAIYLGCNTNVTLNYNDFQFAQEFGRIGGTTYSTFAIWKSGTGFDANSLNTDPQLVNLGGTQPVDYQTNVQLTGTTLAAIPSDFDNVNRVTPTMGAWEFFANPVEIWNGTTYRNAYPTLKGAFDVINAGTYTGDMIIKFRGNTTETASAVLNASGNGAASYTRILIYPARTGITVTGNLATPMVELNGSDKVTFDGRVNGTDAPYEFTFINNSTSATAGTSTFSFNNTATSDTLRYCIVKGGATGSATGNIILGSASAVSGNNNNVITNNKITSLSDANRPVNVIYSAGSVGFANTGTKILSNEIFDFFRPASASFGVNMQAYSNATTISGNSFYETTSFAPSSTAAYRVINIDDTNSNTNVISSNFIGGNAASAAGTWTKTNANNNEFNAIYINAGTSTASTIDGNIIKNITYGNSANANWYGIHVAGGALNVGKIAGNTLGATTGTGSLAITNATSGGTVFGINIASTGIVQVENNNIGSITATNASTNATNFVGINKTATAGTTSILKNTIGSTATANSINASSGSTSNAQTVYAIDSDGTGAITISENTIANLTNGTTNTTVGTRGRINGILITDGTANTVNANTIRNLTIANANTANDFEVSAIGINLINTIANRTITNNVIYSLSNTYASYAGSVIGIYYRGATSGTNTVAQNFIHSL
ncbi:MAG: beta strand repeat-containing protein, partial [Paludibacter sp.]